MNWDEDQFLQFYNMTDILFSLGEDILRRSLNGMLEKEGALYLFHPVTLEAITDEMEMQNALAALQA